MAMGSLFVVRRSRSGLGLGLFARRHISRGASIVEYTGARVSTAEANTLKTRYVLEVDEEWSIDGSPRMNVARYINHSCVPNCEGRLIDGRVFIYTLRDILAGEELTLDYGDEYFDEFIRPKGCECERCVALRLPCGKQRMVYSSV